MNILKCLSANSRHLHLKFLITAALVVLTLPAQAATISVNCDSYWRSSINYAIGRADDGDTVVVYGTCTENVTINKDIILEGQGNTSISPDDPSVPTIRVVSSDATVANFSLVATSDRSHISIGNHSFVTVDNNVIANAKDGIFVSGGSLAVIVNNQINNSSRGIFVGENSTGRIGFRDFEGVSVESNIIEANIDGITFARASGYVTGNHIINNTQAGILSARSSSVRVSGNEIDGNVYGILNTSQANTDLAFNAASGLAYGDANFGVNSIGGIVCNSGFIADTVGPDFGPVSAGPDCINNTVP